MPVQHKPVFSSHVSTIGYDDASGELHVVYANGKTAIYKGVPPGVAQQVQSGVSVGSSLNGLVKGKFSHRYLDG